MKKKTCHDKFFEGWIPEIKKMVKEGKLKPFPKKGMTNKEIKDFFEENYPLKINHR